MQVTAQAISFDAAESSHFLMCMCMLFLQVLENKDLESDRTNTTKGIAPTVSTERKSVSYTH